MEGQEFRVGIPTKFSFSIFIFFIHIRVLPRSDTKTGHRFELLVLKLAIITIDMGAFLVLY